MQTGHVLKLGGMPMTDGKQFVGSEVLGHHGGLLPSSVVLADLPADDGGEFGADRDRLGLRFLARARHRVFFFSLRVTLRVCTGFRSTVPRISGPFVRIS